MEESPVITSGRFVERDDDMFLSVLGTILTDVSDLKKDRVDVSINDNWRMAESINAPEHAANAILNL